LVHMTADSDARAAERAIDDPAPSYGATAAAAAVPASPSQPSLASTAAATPAARSTAAVGEAAAGCQEPVKRKAVVDSILCTAPGAWSLGTPLYSNVAPWVTKHFFVHSYYAYVYVFFMFVLAFYKGYTLEYPGSRQVCELLLIMSLPALQHLRFFFGYAACDHGMFYDLCAFLALCSVVNWILMYFLFMQAYIIPLETTFLSIAMTLVLVESFVGVVNTMQAMKLQRCSGARLVCAWLLIVMLLATLVAFVTQQLLPRTQQVEELYPRGGRLPAWLPWTDGKVTRS